MGKQIKPDPMPGLKYDSEKPRWDLLPLDIIEEIVKVLTIGAQKYDDDNWRKVANGKKRYYAALMRHIKDYQAGEMLDQETGLPHLAHAGCCLIFIMGLEKEGK